MATSAAIPRFLLPQTNPLWRTRLLTNSQISRNIRHASKSSSFNGTPKPIVLEKPAKFNPPSHPARLRREPPRYPGPQLSATEEAAQRTKKYPNMMPPEGTFMHWFLHSTAIHLWISLGTLFTLAATVWITNFKNNSPVGDMLPRWSQLFLHPIAFTRTCLEVLKLHTAQVSAETQERRKRKVEDVAKRSAYRKAHGLEESRGFGGWTAKTDADLVGPAIPLGEGSGDQEVVAGDLNPVEEQRVRRKKPVKRWFGIWE